MATITKEAPQQQQQQQQGPPPTSSSTTAEEEALKRNTDCVYFLASPLTCKKGNECEFRHSDYARMNPRDCYYWLSGNCMNPKCAFRHPPLDGLVPQGANVAGPSPPVPQGLPVPTTPQNAAKQGVPCIFFQKGYCLKGDRCPFLHGPVATPNAMVQQAPASTAVATEAPAFKKTFGGPVKCLQTQVNFHANVPRVVEAPRQAQVNAVHKVESARPVQGGVPAGKRIQPPNGVTGEAPRYKEATAAPVENGSLRSRTARAHHTSSVDEPIYQNGRDVDESLRESSPGFDVLVDDKLREDQYYHNEDQFPRMGGHDRRNPDEFEVGPDGNYISLADTESDIYRNRRGYDPYDRVPEKHGLEQLRRSSERTLGEAAQFDRRGRYKSESPDFVQNSDLRHRLSKQRRGTGLRSVVNPDHHSEDRGYRSSRRDAQRSPRRDGHRSPRRDGHRSPRRDAQRSPVRENSLGGRLQGRIKLPRRSPPLSGGSRYSERENERGRNWGRLSPNRRQVSSHQGRLRDRLSGLNQDGSSEERSFRSRSRNDSIQPNGADFAAPKRLSELKYPRQTDNKPKSEHSVSGGKLRDTVLPSSLGTESTILFDGPKPLSEILKRKRNSGSADPVNGVNPDNKELNKQKKDGVNLISSGTDSAVDTGEQASLSSEPQQRQSVVQENNKSLIVEGDEEEGEISNKKTKLSEAESSLPSDEKHPETEEDVIDGDGEEQEVGDGEELEGGEGEELEGGEVGEHEGGDGEEQELDEEYEQGDGEYEYEQDDGEGYDLNEGENADHDDYMDEDDGDDFAKKLGVSF